MYCFAKICRLCTTNSNVYSSLYNCDEYDVKLLDKLLTFLPDLIRPNDNLPVHICTSCHERLCQAYDFREQCLYSHRKLNRYLVQIQNISCNEVPQASTPYVTICNGSNINNIKTEYESNITNIKSENESNITNINFKSENNITNIKPDNESNITNIKSESYELKSFKTENIDITENNLKMILKDNQMYRQFICDIQNYDERNSISDKSFKSEMEKEFVSKQNHSIREMNRNDKIEFDLENTFNIGNVNGDVTNIRNTNNWIEADALNDYNTDFNVGIRSDYSECENKIIYAIDKRKTICSTDISVIPSKDQDNSIYFLSTLQKNNLKSICDELIENSKMETNKNQKQKIVLKIENARLNEVEVPLEKNTKIISMASEDLRSDHSNDENTARYKKRKMNNNEVQIEINTKKHKTKRDENDIGNNVKSTKDTNRIITGREENEISNVNFQIVNDLQNNCENDTENIIDNGYSNKCSEEENILTDDEFDDTDLDNDFILELDSDSSEYKNEHISTRTRRRSTRSMGIIATPSNDLEYTTNVLSTLQNKLKSTSNKTIKESKMFAKENKKKKTVLKYVKKGILGDDVTTEIKTTINSMEREENRCSADMNENTSKYGKEKTNHNEVTPRMNLNSIIIERDKNVKSNNNNDKLTKFENETRIENYFSIPKKVDSTENAKQYKEISNNDSQIKFGDSLDKTKQIQKEIENEKREAKNDRIAVLLGALKNPNDPTEFICQHPIDPDTKIIFISDLIRSVFFCKFCKINFSEVYGLYKHMVRHTGIKNHVCKICGKKTFTNTELIVHMKIHSPDKQIPCKECGKTYKNKGALRVHTLRHTQPTKYMCDICGKGFPFTHNLQKHKSVHIAERNFVCAQCGAAFKTLESLKIHCVKHRTEKKFECATCKVKFLSAERLRMHVRLHNESNRKFKCTECDKSFFRNRDLLLHGRLHTGEKPFICKHCGKQFRRQPAYNNHVRIHTGAKPYVCKVCEKGFSQLTSRAVHMRIHTGEKPYKCSECDKSYTQSYVYKQHVKKHHSK